MAWVPSGTSEPGPTPPAAPQDGCPSDTSGERGKGGGEAEARTPGASSGEAPGGTGGQYAGLERAGRESSWLRVSLGPQCFAAAPLPCPAFGSSGLWLRGPHRPLSGAMLRPGCCGLSDGGGGEQGRSRRDSESRVPCPVHSCPHSLGLGVPTRPTERMSSARQAFCGAPGGREQGPQCLPSRRAHGLGQPWPCDVGAGEFSRCESPAPRSLPTGCQQHPQLCQPQCLRRGQVSRGMESPRPPCAH